MSRNFGGTSVKKDWSIILLKFFVPYLRKRLTCMVVTPGLSTKSYKQLGGRSTIFEMPKELTLSHRSPGMLETCCQTKPFKTPPLKTS